MKMDLVRHEVSKQFDNHTWKVKVQKMSDQQVLAIYFRLKKDK